MKLGGDITIVIPKLSKEIKNGINNSDYFKSQRAAIEASLNEDYQVCANLYEVFPHFNAYGVYAEDLYQYLG